MLAAPSRGPQAKERRRDGLRGEHEAPEKGYGTGIAGGGGDRRHLACRRVRRELPRSSRQRQPGLRHRRAAGHEPATGPQGQGRLQEAGRQPGRGRLPAGRQRQGLSRPRRRWLPFQAHLRDVGAAPQEHLDLQPDPAGGRLRLHVHARRHRPRSRRPSAGARRGRPLPDARRVRGLRLRQSVRPGERDQPDPQPARLRRRRREHARHRLLRRRLRLLREAPEPGRLRRRRDRRAPALGPPQPGRHGRRLLRRDQPALRRRHRPAPPRRDHTAVRDRQHRDHALSGRVPQYGLRPEVGRGSRRRLEAGLADRGPGRGPTSGSRTATRSARPIRPCTPPPRT